MNLYIGTDDPLWLGRCAFRLMVSRRRLHRLGAKRWPRARAPWMLDSGGFTELSLHGRWALTSRDYVGEVRRAADAVGRLAAVAPMDWMCEPHVVQRTGLSVARHQILTVAYFERLRDLAPDLPWLPVLQGWDVSDYLRCVDLYARAGINLGSFACVGVGSVCRRQHTAECGAILSRLAGEGLALHAFGMKFQGLSRFQKWLASADTMAWSYNARRNPALPGCSHSRCNHCLLFARAWRGRLLKSIS